MGNENMKTIGYGVLGQTPLSKKKKKAKNIYNKAESSDRYALHSDS